MPTLYNIGLTLVGLGLVTYSCVKMFQVWPRDFFISENGRTRRSVKSGFAGSLLIFGASLLMLVFLGEQVSIFQLLRYLCFFGSVSIFIGIIGAISIYKQLWMFTKTKDDIGTIRDE